MLIVSGITMISLYPFTAATNASAMPVFPLVGSIKTVLPAWMVPAFSASLIMLTPMRSLTLAQGLKLSSLASTVAFAPAVTLFSRTSGVWPISSVTSLAIFIRSLLGGCNLWMRQPIFRSKRRTADQRQQQPKRASLMVKEDEMR